MKNLQNIPGARNMMTIRESQKMIELATSRRLRPGMMAPEISDEVALFPPEKPSSARWISFNRKNPPPHRHRPVVEKGRPIPRQPMRWIRGNPNDSVIHIPATENIGKIPAASPLDNDASIGSPQAPCSALTVGPENRESCNQSPNTHTAEYIFPEHAHTFMILAPVRRFNLSLPWRNGAPYPEECVI